MNNSAGNLDFIGALALLLSRGELRDEFRASAEAVAEKIGVSSADRAAFVGLDAREVEEQADVLLRKRLDALRPLIPENLASLGANLWPLFRQYARNRWSMERVDDASEFLDFLRRSADTVRICRAEANRLQFRQGKATLRLHAFWKKKRPAVQLLLRARSGRTREWHFYPGL